MTILGFLEGFFKVGVVLSPILVLLAVYPDLTKRDKNLNIDGKNIPIHDATLPEKRHPNFNRWMNVYFITYIGLYSYYWYSCGVSTPLEWVVGLMLSAPFVLDTVLMLLGLGDSSLISTRNCL